MQVSRRSTLSLFTSAALGPGESHASLPNIGFKGPTNERRTECGIGALMPWADALWVITYTAHEDPGPFDGAGLHRIDDTFRAERLNLHRNGANANRFVHSISNQCIIGPYIIDMQGNWKYLKAFDGHRLTGTMQHLTDPANRVYLITMGGLFFEMDINTLEVRLISDICKLFNITSKPHFKGGAMAQGRVVVTNNGFYEFGDKDGGLFEYDGKQWRRLSGKPHMDAFSYTNFGNVLFATGWDESSSLFHALVKGQWQTYRLPKASHAYNNGIQTEWMRIREIETEHLMVDLMGMFYELQPIAFEGRIWGVNPVCSHIRIIPDYCPFRGLLALGGNQGTPIKFRGEDHNVLGGQPQSGIWFCVSDDMWKWGKPRGWGGPWRNSNVKAGVPSDPFLFTGFEHKVLHVASDRPGNVDIEIDFLGNGSWRRYERLTIGSDGYRQHVFPTGFSAHWVRLVPDVSTRMSAEFMFT